MERDVKITVSLIIMANILKRSPFYTFIYLAVIIISSRKSWKSLPRLYMTALIVGFFAELIGTRVCLPFGCYHYKNLQPQIYGVALFVPLTWGIFGFFSYLTAYQFFRKQSQRIFFASFLMVVIDLAVDPIMTSWGAWIWETTTDLNWFGIPWVNYLGWFLTSLAFFTIYESTSKVKISEDLYRFGALIYLLEMATFVVHAPDKARIPAIWAFLIGLMVLIFSCVLQSGES